MLDTSFKYVPLVLAFTPNYIIPAATTILSILEHSDENDKFEVICLLTEEIPEDIKHILQSWDKDRLKFVFFNLSDKLGGVYIDERYTAAASYRLLLPDLLPDYPSVIYLDCDIIVRNNIAHLFHTTDLSRYYLAAVFEATLDFQEDYVESIGCDPSAYINSGFLIMNLRKMREDNIVSQLIEASNNPNSNFPDQDALNIVCKDFILGLPPFYNSIRTFLLPQYKDTFLKYYSAKDWKSVQNHGTIHYTGSKPWNGYTVKFEIWWKYYRQLPPDLRSLSSPNGKLLFLSRLLNITLFNNVFNFGRFLYRIIK